MVDSLIMCVMGGLLILCGLFFDRIPLRLFSFSYLLKDADMDSEPMRRLVTQTEAVLKATGWTVILCAVSGILFRVFWLRFYVPLWIGILGGSFLVVLWSRKAPRKIRIAGWIGAASGLIVTLVVTVVLAASVKTEMAVGEKGLVIGGAYSLDIPYDAVDTVYLSPEPPHTTIRTNGLSMNGIRKGYFKLEEGARCYLNTDAKVPLYVYIIRKGELPAIINWQSREKTEELFRMLREKIPATK